MKVLDCTLRDGGYYTNWDFSEDFVLNYLEAVETADIEYIEIGYRSKELKEYRGEYYYLPKSRINWIKSKSSKKLAVMLDVKNLELTDVFDLLDGLHGEIELVRLAATVDSYKNLNEYVRVIKSMGFDVAINFMRLSEWINKKDLIQALFNWSREVQVKYVYLVDSYGSVFPDELDKLKTIIASNNDLKFGFHAHDNLSLGFANALRAKELSFELLDSTFLGMGRGAGNLKTELLIQFLRKGELRPYSSSYYLFLDKITKLQAKYSWGVSHSYITAALAGFPQGKIMDLLNLRNSNIKGIDNIILKKNVEHGKHDQINSSMFNLNKSIIIGGGNSVKENNAYILTYANNSKSQLVFTSSKYLEYFSDYSGDIFVVLVGDEIQRFNSMNISRKITFIANRNDPNTIMPDNEKNVLFLDLKEVSRTGIALEIFVKVKSNSVEIIGYDGYEGEVTPKEAALALENQKLFKNYSSFLNLVSLLPSKCDLALGSIFARV